MHELLALVSKTVLTTNKPKRTPSMLMRLLLINKMQNTKKMDTKNVNYSPKGEALGQKKHAMNHLLFVEVM